jgi:hypothetical protein
LYQDWPQLGYVFDEGRLMAIFHIAYHGYRQPPSQEEFEDFAGMLNAYFAAAPYIEDGAAGAMPEIQTTDSTVQRG